jgi:two-component system, OmpR family, sensor kinase
MIDRLAPRRPGGARRPRSSYATRSSERLRRGLHELPLRLRLVAIVVLLLLAALTVTTLATSALLNNYLLDRTDRDLQLAAVPVAQAALDQLTDHPSEIKGFVAPNIYAVRIMPTNGGAPHDLVNAPNQTVHPDIPQLSISDPRVRSGDPFTVGSQQGEQDWRVVAGSTHGGSATFAVAVSLSGVERTVHQLRFYTVLLGLAMTVAGAVLGWYAVRRAFRPLTQIEDTAAAIAAGDLTRRIPPTATRDEVSSLATSLNVMLAQIEQSFAVREASEQRMRQFVADASHELRTPLATVRGYAELFRQGAVRDPEDVAGAMRRIEDEATRMGGLVEDLLLLTRLDSHRPSQYAPVDLTVLAGDATQDAAALAPGRRIRLLGLDGELGPVVVDGDEARLRQVLTNLVANAVNHTPQGSPIEIAVGTRGGATEPERAVLEVRDHGQGIDPAEAPKVFERFYRADPSRARGHGGGNGLGLAIVAAIVISHRGKVGLAPTPGGGATFVVELPPATSQEPHSNP